jgi:outer membrane receptor protein involved in Fe transport
VFHQSCNAGVTTDGPVALADLSAAYDTSDGKWRVSLQVENLTDRVYFTGIFGVAGLRMASAYVAPPRRASVTFRYQYR